MKKVISWMVALSLLPISVYLIYYFFTTSFEWLLSMTVEWGKIPHIIFWLFFGWIMVKFATVIGGILASISFKIVDNSDMYHIILMYALFGLVGYCLYKVWFTTQGFGWQNLDFPTFNKIIYTLIILSMFRIPFAMNQENVELRGKGLV